MSLNVQLLCSSALTLGLPQLIVAISFVTLNHLCYYHGFGFSHFDVISLQQFIITVQLLNVNKQWLWITNNGLKPLFRTTPVRNEILK